MYVYFMRSHEFYRWGEPWEAEKWVRLLKGEFNSNDCLA